MGEFLSKIADCLDISGLNPWVRPFPAFIAAVIAAALHFFNDYHAWAWVVFLIALGLAVWVLLVGLAEEGVGSTAKAGSAYLAGVYAAYLIMYFGGALLSLDGNAPEGCGIVKTRSPDECITAYENRALEQQKSAPTP